MDDFERELREMLNDRVASMPAAHDVTPELLTHARRRRATKLTALAVSVVIVAGGTAGAIAQLTGDDGPRRVVTPTPTSGPERPSVPTVECPVTIPPTASVSLTPPSTIPRVPDAGDPAELTKLQSYAASDDPRSVVLGPSTWSCHGTIVLGGGMVVYDPNATPGQIPSIDAAPIAIENDVLWRDPFGALLACSVFDDPEVLQFTKTNYEQNCLRSRSPQRTVTRVDDQVATFVDANGDRGVGWMILPSSMTANDGKISVLTCRPTAGLTVETCDAIIADYAARLAASVPTPTREIWSVIPAPPFKTYSHPVWNGSELIIGASMNLTSRAVAAYDPKAGSWRSLPDAPFTAPVPAVAIGTNVYAAGHGETDSSSAFGVFDSTAGTWRRLAKPPDTLGLSHAFADTVHAKVYFFGDIEGSTIEPFNESDAWSYDIATDTWTTLPRSGLANRDREAIVWTGSELIVWSGGNAHQGGIPPYDDGAVFDPAVGAWHPMADAPISARIGAAAVWTGDEMVVWGGPSCPEPYISCNEVGYGAAYDPATDSWRAIAEPPFRSGPSPAIYWYPAAVWNGTEMVAFAQPGNFPNPDAANYDPTINRWTGIAAKFPASVREVVGRGSVLGSEWTGDGAIFLIQDDHGEVHGVRFRAGK